MRKNFILLLSLLFVTALFADTRRIYCKMEHQWWYSVGAAVAAHYWGGTGATEWPGVRMERVSGQDNMWYLDVDESHNMIIFVRVSGTDPLTDWGAQTGNLSIPTNGDNLFTISNADPTWGGNPGCTGTWSYYADVNPNVWFENTAKSVFLDEEIMLEVASKNVKTPVYAYTVKIPGTEDFVAMETAETYQPQMVGEYLFKVTVAESAAPTTVLATAEKSVMVREVPDPITIKVKVPEEWGNVVSFWCWDDYNPGMWVTAGAEDDWYTVTVERVYPLSFIVVAGNNEWPAVDKSLQTVDVAAVTSDGCYQVGEPDEMQENKRTVSTTECKDPAGPGTLVDMPEQTSLVMVENGQIKATFAGMQRVQLCSVSGQVLYDGLWKDSFVCPSTEGIYLLRIGNDTHKVVVR